MTIKSIELEKEAANIITLLGLPPTPTSMAIFYLNKDFFFFFFNYTFSLFYFNLWFFSLNIAVTYVPIHYLVVHLGQDILLGKDKDAFKHFYK
jgi:hypothetical protein